MGSVWELYAPAHVLLEICSLLGYGLLPTDLSFSAYCLFIYIFFVFLPQVVDYYLEQLGCPFKRLKNEPFKAVIDPEVSRFARTYSRG